MLFEDIPNLDLNGLFLCGLKHFLKIQLLIL
jgi:hypothetical protein